MEQQQNPQGTLPTGGTIPSNDEYQALEIGFIRKRDAQVIYVRIIDLMQAIKTIDFINNEITLKDEVCQLNSIQKKIEPLGFILNVLKVADGGNGSYTIDGVLYSDNHKFTIAEPRNVAITLTPEFDSRVDSVVDGDGISYEIINSVVTIPVAAAMNLTITFKSISI